ncbi:hypothetical protein D1872_293520 [compost metagenome]
MWLVDAAITGLLASQPSMIRASRDPPATSSPPPSEDNWEGMRLYNAPTDSLGAFNSCGF